MFRRITSLLWVACVGLLSVAIGSSFVINNKGTPVSRLKSNETTTFFDGSYTELFVVTRNQNSNELVTTEFFEKRPDLGIAERQNQVNWEIVVPEEANLFIGTSGHLLGFTNSLWVGWRKEDSLSALSVLQERPIKVEVGPHDSHIPPAVIGPDGQMTQYFWRSEEQAWALYRHVFTGQMDEPGTVETQRVMQILNHPELSTVAPVPGDEEGHLVLAWGERRSGGLVLRSVHLNGERTKPLKTMAISEMSLLQNQRLALHVIPENATAWASGIVQVGEAQYGILEGQFDFAKEEVSINIDSLHGQTGAQLHSGQVFYYKDPTEHRHFVGTLSEEGTLTIQRPGRGKPQVLRREVPLSYDFPILTSLGARYEAKVTEEGDVDLVSIP